MASDPTQRRALFEQPRVVGCSTQGMWSLLWKVPEAYGQIPSKELWEQILPADPKPARSPPPPRPRVDGCRSWGVGYDENEAPPTKRVTCLTQHSYVPRSGTAKPGHQQVSCIGGNFFRVKGQQSLQHTYGNSSVTPGTEPAYGWQGRSSPCAPRSVSVTRPGWSRLPASCLETPETRAHTRPLGAGLLPAGGGSASYSADTGASTGSPSLIFLRCVSRYLITSLLPFGFLGSFNLYRCCFRNELLKSCVFVAQKICLLRKIHVLHKRHAVLQS